MRDLLDLDRYPLDQPGSQAWHQLVASCQQELAQSGMFNLPGFMRENVAKSEANSLSEPFQTDAFSHTRDHNIYFRNDIEGLPSDHPSLRRFETSNRTLCADQLGDSALIALYEWREFARFLAACMNKSKLFVMADPLARVNAMSYGDGQALNWHFDRSEFTTTLLLQAPQSGGAFEYRSDLRSATDPNHDGVARLLAGQDDQVRQIDLSPGTLNVFKGKNTAHRVTPVQGGINRMIAVFSYYERPGVMFSAQERVGFYGRES